MTATPVSRRRLPLSDLTRLSTVGLRTRKLRAGLSALGIAIGVAAIVAVLGLSASSQAGLLAEISRLGTNLLTVSNGQSLTGGTAELPTTAPAMIGRISGVQQVQSTGTVSGANASAPPTSPRSTPTASPSKPPSLDLLRGRSPPASPKATTSTRPPPRSPSPYSARPPPSCSASTASTPANASGSGGQWFYLAGILNPAVLASAIDTSVLVGYPAAEKYLGFDGHPSTIYLRAQNDRVNAVDNLLAATANPENPGGSTSASPPPRSSPRPTRKRAERPVPRPRRRRPPRRRGWRRQHHDHLRAGAPFSEIGLRRALGATKGHIRTQFLSEAVPPRTARRNAVGVALGVTASPSSYAHTRALGHHHPHRSLGRRESPRRWSSARSPG